MIRPLSGIRVTGLEQYMAGPYCTMLLADAGAEVIKIERPGKGDPRRSIPPFVDAGGTKMAAGFMGYNRNKKSLALDVGKPEGQEIFRKLCSGSDVVVENIRPGSMDRQGLGYADMRMLNPRLIWAVISGFGRLPGYTGPYSDRPAFDIVAEAMSGVMHQVGFADKPPSWTIYGMADVYSGLVTAFGILQALLMRERTGEGQMVDSSMLDNMLALNEQAIGMFGVSGQVVSRGRLKNVWPRGAFKCSDGYIALNVPDNVIWARLAETVGHPELAADERSKSGPARSENAEFLRPVIENWLAGRTRAEAVDALNTAGVPTGPVYTTEDVFADPHVKARGMLMDVGGHTFARTAPHLEKNAELPAEPAPRLGQDTREVLDSLGYSPAEVDSLIERQVVEAAD